MIQVLFVCLGNICRSPTADGIFRHFIEDAGLQDKVYVDSAGTGDWHIGRAPDPRSQAAARQRGYDLSMLRARQVSSVDFSRFDYILAMDNANLRDLQRMKPANYQGHLGLFLAFGERQDYREVPDPYYGENDGFELVLDLVEDAARGLLTDIRQRHL
ncbi:low molecular weight protein-tyrosine-phosphatase [Cellvibrio japonicus]|uniref:protein-tyrosine-phosphatase n=1 Tax=Cellvibrio japonicus (strain Ueda107) TaxID=498211 RepID=B3PFS0_CELJU|nr:low molecular weight protein-tyrosine-phosphatase [Cellvibrio japonicus]ACE84508.1 protein-tyrosine-phosphatase [Cellvibrio japonicus Ueda107]QEI12293.1 low molecular weight phosphotyrosine protein phosphatase [Cellvibrio japonicus]QEI15867.1 low molecular weight phosphotyrosine protein phosphatase [Cellvibrio japonicus]QEI19445.1 low molecular weight phosphotyrosine protein phosphatase [Cellvibrio japonicus]